jgi:flagellar operon protein
MVDKIGSQTTVNSSARLSPASGAQATRQGQRAQGGSSFQEVLQGRLDSQQSTGTALRFSAHAQERMRSREIQLDSSGVARLEQAVARADQKGARDSLVLMDDLALLVSVRNRVVVTAVPQSSAKDNVFTNIDSVVIA